jgi:UDP-glucose 4-epimerase
MANVVVTGGCGFIGGHLTQFLAHRGDRVVTYDTVPPPPSLPETAGGHVVGDIRDAARLATVIRPGAEVVYHLCALVGVDRYLEYPLDVIDVNVQGTRNVLECASAAGAKVVVASTSEVYGKNPAVPWAEEADRVLGGTSVERWSYATSKAMAEHLTYAFVRQHGLRAAIVRYFNVYGPGQRPAYVLSRNIHRALRGLPLMMYDDGRQTRCFTYVGDAVEATATVGSLTRCDGESFNVGSSDETPVAEALQLIGQPTGASQPPVHVQTSESLGRQYEDIGRRAPDTAKARTVLGWKCRTPLRDGLAATVAWARENPWWLELPERGATAAAAPAGRRA